MSRGNLKGRPAPVEGARLRWAIMIGEGALALLPAMGG